jgi:hypothetical protein
VCVPADSRPLDELTVVLTVPPLERVRWSLELCSMPLGWA